MTFKHVSEIKRANIALGHHFFDADAMAFFRSRIGGGLPLPGRKGTDTMTLSIGSRAFGTHRLEDIADAVLGMAAEIGNDLLESDTFQSLAAALDHYEDDHECDSDDCPGEWLSEEIENAIDALQEHAPIFCYIGHPEGDGANFGVWPSVEAIEEAIRTGERIDSETVVNETEGVRIHVSDHGNIEIYSLDSGASLLSLV